MKLYTVTLNEKIRYFGRRAEADAFVAFLGDGTVEAVHLMNLHSETLARFVNDVLRDCDELLAHPEELEEG